MRAMATLHALLIGIDATPGKPLHGCVRDVDAVQRALLDPRLAPAHITRLVAPLPGAVHDTAIADGPPTLAAIRAALAHLASDAVAGDDRVFVFFSGHGARTGVPKHAPTDYREALVPVDYGADKPDGGYRLLYDDELNHALAAIARRTPAVAVVLDCCFAAGVTRGDGTARFLDLSDGVNAHDTRSAPAAHRALTSGLDACHVVAACLPHECANEWTDRHGVVRGLFTQAFTHALDSARDDARDFATLTWAEIWQAVRHETAGRNAGQHPWMAGHLARRVFGGPPVHGDAGMPIAHAGAGYELLAGSLAGVTRGAEIAVYGHQPAYFAPIGSRDDEAARLGVVRVTHAGLSVAHAVARDAPFAVPPGARGRLIAAGDHARVHVAIEPAVAGVVAAVAGSPLLSIHPDPHAADVRLVERDGVWHVTDEIHPSLFAFADGQRARAVLEHYVAYARPFRIAAAGVVTDGLGLRVLACPDHVRRAPAADALHLRDHLPEAPSPGAGRYHLRAGDAMCFEVRNHAPHRQLVTLVNAAASGKVQLLATQLIEPGAREVFWSRNQIHQPFAASPPADRATGIDRLIAIGRPPTSTTLDFLRVDATFADALAGQSPPSPPSPGDPLTRGADAAWTVTQVVIETRR